MNTLLGTQLCGPDQQTVLRSYTHRFTREHMPKWACKPRPDGSIYPVQFASDADWLAHTHFHIKQDGRLDARFHACESTATWPDNPELRR